MNRDQLIIRRLGYSDLPQVMAVERRAFPTPWSLAMFVLELSKPSSVCLAAMRQADDPVAIRQAADRAGLPDEKADGVAGGGHPRRQERLVGYLICARYADTWHLMNVAVDPSERRRGIATALLSEMLARAGAREPYTLEVRPSNTGAIALYEQFGFRSAGRRPRYYRDTGEDALIMWRTESASTSRLRR